ncbi:MAG: ABC transporter ATP-binding protein, partial [Actinomycetota bacterium]
AIVLAVAGRLAIDGDLEPGDIVAFTGLATFLAIPFRTIAELFITWAGGIASARRLDELLQAPHRVAAGGGAGGGSNGSLGLHFEAVEAPGLQQFDLSIGADEVVGVASADPDAATTILRLAARHLAPTAGTVRLGHTDLGDLRLDVVRGTVLVDDASQPWLRPGTVGDNLDLAITPHECDDPARHAEHLAALRLAALDELLERDDPLDVLIGSRGLRLSGGQRQRLAVARSVRADSAVLALLDPTSALDSVTESRVAAALVDARRNRCTLLLTTSPAVLARCDRVVFVSDGAVVADGTHAEILHEPEYAALLGATPLEPRA